MNVDIGRYVLQDVIQEKDKYRTFKGIHKKTSKIVQVLEFPSESSIPHGLSVSHTVDCPFIQENIERIDFEGRIYFVFEYLANGSIKKRFDEKGKFLEDEARRIFIQLLLALEYYHTQIKCVHKNVCFDTVYLDKYSNIKLSDPFYAQSIENEASEAHSMPEATVFTAPEVLKGGNYTPAADIWSAGVLLTILLTGYAPFEGDTETEMTENVTTSEPVFKSKLTPPIRDFLLHMLRKSPSQRSSISDLLKHPWMQLYHKYSDLLSLVNGGTLSRLPIRSKVVSKLTSVPSDLEEIARKLTENTVDDVVAEYKILCREDTILCLRPFGSTSYQAFSSDAAASNLERPAARQGFHTKRRQYATVGGDVLNRQVCFMNIAGVDPSIYGKPIPGSNAVRIRREDISAVGPVGRRAGNVRQPRIRASYSAAIDFRPMQDFKDDPQNGE